MSEENTGVDAPTDQNWSNDVDFFTDQDIDTALGRSSEEDVLVADPPPSSGEAVETEEETATEATEEVTEEPSEAEPAEAEQPVTEEPDKFDWSTSPKAFRERYEKVRDELLELKKSSLDQTFLTDTSAFKEKIQDLSEAQYSEFVQSIVNEQANGNPQGWAQFFVEHHADLIAQTITGDSTMTAERLRQEREILADDDLESWSEEKGKAKPDDKFAELQNKLNEFETKERQKEIQTIRSEVFREIAEPGDTLFTEAGLEIAPDDTDAEKAFKTEVGEAINVLVANRLETDPKIAHIAQKAKELIEKGDGKGAKNLIRPLQAFVEAETARLIEVFTTSRVRREAAKTITKEPPKVVAGAAKQAGQPSPPKEYSFGEDIDFMPSDSELAAAVYRK